MSMDFLSLGAVQGHLSTVRSLFWSLKPLKATTSFMNYGLAAYQRGHRSSEALLLLRQAQSRHWPLGSARVLMK